MDRILAGGLLAALYFVLMNGCAWLGVPDEWCALVASITWIVALALFGVIVLERQAHRRRT